MNEQQIDALIEWARSTATYVTDEQDAINLGAMADALEALRPGPDDWEYAGVPFTTDGEEWEHRTVEACEELVAEYQNPRHWVYEPRNADLSPVAGYRVIRRRPAGPWMEVVPDDRA